jgi:xanthine dehydrogenase molybdenum-binding subunit
MSNSPVGRQYGPQYKLIGKDYATADLYAKVTGKSRYAEDFRAEGMLFCKLLLSTVPHGKVRRIDASEAMKMPGVKAILTANDLPAPADTLTDNGTVIKASKRGERGLTMEPVYQGEPVLAVAAVDELTAAETIERIRIDFERLPFAVDPLDTLRPDGPNPRTDGNIWVSRPGATAPVVAQLKWTDADFAEETHGRLPMGKTPDEWSYGDLDAGFRKSRARAGRNLRYAGCEPPDA